MLDKELNLVLLIFENYNNLINLMDVSMISEIKSIKNPSAQILIVLKMICIVFGISPLIKRKNYK